MARSSSLGTSARVLAVDGSFQCSAEYVGTRPNHRERVRALSHAATRRAAATSDTLFLDVSDFAVRRVPSAGAVGSTSQRLLVDVRGDGMQQVLMLVDESLAFVCRVLGPPQIVHVGVAAAGPAPGECSGAGLDEAEEQVP